MAALLAVIPLTLTAGCGFHPRAEPGLPPALARVFVTGADRDLVARLSDALARRGAVVADSRHGATRIGIEVSRFAQTALTTDSAGRASAYALRYEVVFSVAGGDGAPLLSAQSLALHRAFDYAPARQLHSEEEARFLKDEMRREAAARILRRLSRL